ncbi:MAG TPA: glycosyltransferase family 4 protein [Ilumatobacteraceae bacterium]|nr:glycosyltransferase family 4 protein [Ilumatobacteraceae bacterium]
MRVLMLSWEYPPLVVGGIAAHVDGLARALVRAGHEVVVFSLATPDCDDDTATDGVRVVRANIDLPWLPDDNLIGQMASANHHLTQLVTSLGDWRPDIVHAHDWLVAWAGDTIATLTGAPLVATIHATERGRHGGHLPHGTPAAINSIEWWLTYQARSVICCSNFMVRELLNHFELPTDKVHRVPNGVDLDVWAPPSGGAGALGGGAALDPGEASLVVAWGRVQYEKGFQVLVRAIGALRDRGTDAPCIIAGRGSYLAELQSLIDTEGLGDRVQLAGFVADDELRALLHRAAVAVIPSLYEPFGIVALEAMAAGVPTVVAATGGLAETVRDTGAGLLFEPGNHHDLATQIGTVLDDPTVSRSLRSRAADVIGQYTWDAIAASTAAVYDATLHIDAT